MSHCTTDWVKWLVAWGEGPRLYTIYIIFWNVDKASAHPCHTHISTFVNQMSWLEKLELSWPFKDLWDRLLCFWEQQYVRDIHAHAHTKQVFLKASTDRQKCHGSLSVLKCLHAGDHTKAIDQSCMNMTWTIIWTILHECKVSRLEVIILHNELDQWFQG